MNSFYVIERIEFDQRSILQLYDNPCQASNDLENIVKQYPRDLIKRRNVYNTIPFFKWIKIENENFYAQKLEEIDLKNSNSFALYAVQT